MAGIRALRVTQVFIGSYLHRSRSRGAANQYYDGSKHALEERGQATSKYRESA
jgi:hypothetical protein